MLAILLPGRMRGHQRGEDRRQGNDDDDNEDEDLDHEDMQDGYSDDE